MTPTVAVIGSVQVYERFVLVDACIIGLNGQDRYLHQSFFWVQGIVLSRLIGPLRAFGLPYDRT